MKFVIQRVHRASVAVRGQCIAEIESGLLVFVGIQKGDTPAQMKWMIDKLMHLRIFSDDDGKMNYSVTTVKGDILVVPNFTLYADASSGTRPGFSEAERPAKAKKLYKQMIEALHKQSTLDIESGTFGADMDVELINDGPVTIILDR